MKSLVVVDVGCASPTDDEVKNTAEHISRSSSDETVTDPVLII